MTTKRAIACFCLTMTLSAMTTTLPTLAADKNLPPYEQSLRRLSVVVGALMHLDPLCNKSQSQDWYQQMASLLKAENPDDVRNRQITDRFNQSFITLSNTYDACNSQARKLTDLYRQEGQELLNQLRLKHAR